MIIIPFFVYSLIILFSTLGFFNISVFILSITLSERDAFGVSNYLLTLNSKNYVFYVGLFLYLYFFSLYRFYVKKKFFHKRIRKIVLISNVIVFYIFLGSLFKSANVLNGLSTILYNGLVVCTMWPLLFSNKNHNKYLLYFVLVQMSLSMLVLFYPYFSFIDGSIYQKLNGSYVRVTDGLNYTIPDSGFSKSEVGMYGVFHNPNALGFYSTAAIALAYYAWMMRKLRWKVISFILLGMGAMGWLNSITRGPMLFLIVGFIYAYLISLAATRSKSSIIIVLSVLTVLVFFIWSYSDYLGYFFPSATDPSVSGRLSGYSDGLFAIANFPVFGIDRKLWPNLEIPHFLSLYFSSDYGVLAGILITVLVFVCGFQCVLKATRLIIQNSNNRQIRKDSFFAILLTFLCFGIAVSDNLTSPILFWFCFMEAQMLVFQRPYLVKSNRK